MCTMLITSSSLCSIMQSPTWKTVAKGGHIWGEAWLFQLPLQLSKTKVLWCHWAWRPSLCSGWKRLHVLLGCRRGW
jgi:hypothetical protein